MQRMLRSVLLLVFVSSTLIPPLHAAQAQRATSLSTDRPSQLQLSFSAPQPALVESQHGEATFTTFETDLSLSGEPGQPALPVITKVLGVPSSAAAQTDFQAAAPQTLGTLGHPLEPVPQQVLPEGAASEEAPQVVSEYLPDADLYARSEWFPASPVTVSEPETLRGQAVVRVSFTPVQVNLATGEVRWIPSADVTLHWDPATLEPAVVPVEDPHFESLFRGLLDNYEEARAWRAPAQNPAQSIQTPAQVAGENRWIVTLQGAGLFGIPFSQLQAAGVPTGNPNSIAVFLGAQEQHVWIQNNTLYLINQQEPSRWSNQVAYRIEILPSGTGQRMAELPSPATQPGGPVQSVLYDLRQEQDKVYQSKSTPSIYGENWYWVHLKSYAIPEIPQQRTWETTFDLPRLAAGDAQVTTELGPLHNRCHYATVTINGSYSVSRGIADTTACLNAGSVDKWFDTTGFGRVVSVPSAGLRATGNTFKVEMRPTAVTPNNPAGGDEIMLNGFVVRYNRALQLNPADPAERDLFFNSGQTTGRNFQVSGLGAGAVAFEVTTLGQPKRIVGGTIGSTFTFGRPSATIANEKYLIASTAQARTVTSIQQEQSHGLRSDLSQTDYLVIVPPEFEAAVQPLAQHRRSAAGGGHTVRVVTTNEIYSDFGVGMTDPQSIREFIRFGYQNWQGQKLSFVLLVGDATYDPLNNLGLTNAPQLWLPPIMVDKDQFKGETPSDNAFVVALDPGDESSSNSGNRLLADAHIGRLPANSAQQVTDMVNKLVQYETTAPQGAWRRRILLTADNPEPLGSAPDAAGDFHALSENVIPLLPERVDVTRDYSMNGPDPETKSDDGIDAAFVSNRIADHLNYGHLIIQYIGHGDLTRWAGNRGIWTTRRPIDGSVGQFTNDFDKVASSGMIPFALPWTCLEGYYVDPNVQSLSEEMMRMPGKGVIGSFSPTGLDVATAHDKMTLGFYEAMFDVSGDLGGPETQLGPLTAYSKLKLFREAPTTYYRLLDTYLLFGDPATNLQVEPCVNEDGLPCSPDQLYLPVSLTRP